MDGQVYAQPLVTDLVEVPGFGRRRLVIVATMRNTVYAFDADPLGSHLPVWKTNLGPPVPAANYSVGAYYEDLLPFNGILGTPAVDPANRTLYAVAATFESGAYAYRLHALDLATGQARLPAVSIQGEMESARPGEEEGRFRFDPFWHLQRPGLLLANGNVYIAFGSHGGAGPHQGWIFAYRASDLSPAGLFGTAPDARGASIWMSGRGLAAGPDGAIYAATGNGPFDGVRSFGQSVLRLSPDLSVQSWFTPANHEQITAEDNDLGACGPMLLPGGNTLAVGGKTGTVFLLDRGSLGGLSPGNEGALQETQPVTANVYNLAAWQREDGLLLYIPGAWQPVQAFRMNEGKIAPEPASSAESGGGVPYYGMAVSSNGGEPGSGVLWMTSTESGYTGRAWPGVLRAFDASDLGRELWNSGIDPADALPSFAKFATPTVANGLVYVPTFSNQVVVYGLKSSGQDLQSSLRIGNAYSRSGGAVSPGERILVEGVPGLPEEPLRASLADEGKWPVEIDGWLVLLDGEPIPLVEAGPDGITAIVPDWVAGRTGLLAEVHRESWFSKPLPLGVAPAHPGLLTEDGSGMGAGAFFHEDGSPVQPARPAYPGAVLSIAITGVGAPPPTVQGVNVAAGGEPAEILALESGEGHPPELYRLWFRVPETAATGPRIPVVVRVSGSTAPAVTLRIHSLQ